MSNKVNLLVVEIDLLNVIEKYNIKSLISLSFKNKEFISKYLEKLHRFGVVKPINDAIGEELYINYFEDYSFEEDLYSEYCINNILFLDSYLEDDIKCNISDNIRFLLGEENIIDIKEIQKKEYRIYGY